MIFLRPSKYYISGCNYQLDWLSPLTCDLSPHLEDKLDKTRDEEDGEDSQGDVHDPIYAHRLVDLHREVDGKETVDPKHIEEYTEGHPGKDN